jgi:hypothetical protein
MSSDYLRDVLLWFFRRHSSLRQYLPTAMSQRLQHAVLSLVMAAAATNTSPFSHFMSLPLELRNKIWLYLIA